MKIIFDSRKSEYKKPFGALRAGEKCEINIKIPLSCRTKKAELMLYNDNDGENTTVLMTKSRTQADYEIYSALFSLEKCGLYFYHFFISTEYSDFSLYKRGNDTNIGEGEKWQITCFDKEFSVPDEFCGKVMYQIFPDRFYRDEVLSAQEKLKPYYVHKNTDDVPAFLPDENGKILNCDFFGGNLKGIEKKLDYIKSLGVSIIYLNPIFMAYSNHRYDTCDFKKIDPLLGSESDFVSLCDSAHKRGIKIILDGVFSHTGSRSIYFDKEYEFGTGVISNPNSPYKEWFNFRNFPIEYDTWWGIDTLPCTNEMNKGYLNYIINDSDSVTAKWLSLGTDGFRLDVADELPDEFIKLFRKKVKEIKKCSFVVGEVWEDASNKISYGVRRKYFSDSELDSVMNYVFKNAIIAFVRGDISSERFSEEIMTIAENYPHDALHSLMNSLSTHDTARILTALSDADVNMPKDKKAYYKLPDKMRYIAFERLYVAVFLQFMLPGTACIYYGDEIGMEGFGDPFCRGYFKWDSENENLKNFFKALGKIKNETYALHRGGINFVRTDEVLIFERVSSSQKLVAVINMAEEEFESPYKNVLISHRVSIFDNKILINKNGFAAFLVDTER